MYHGKDGRSKRVHNSSSPFFRLSFARFPVERAVLFQYVSLWEDEVRVPFLKNLAQGSNGLLEQN